MKRAALLGFIFVAGLCMAQTRQFDFSQRGIATQEIQNIDGLYAAHPSLPIGSRAIVSNEANGISIEVTVIGRIMASTDRIIDLSPDAVWALDMKGGGEVIVSVPNQHITRMEPPPEPEIVFVPESEIAYIPEPEPEIYIVPEPEIVFIPEPAVAPAPVSPPVQTPVVPAIPPTNITIYSYIVSPDHLPLDQKPEDMEYLEWLSMMILESREGRKARGIEEPRVPKPPENTGFRPEPPVQAPAAVKPPPPAVTPPPPVNHIRVMPGLPDPNSNKVYRLQVGAFSSEETAYNVARSMYSAGFSAFFEKAGNFYRVFAADVPAAVVQYAVKRLEAIGFTEVWVHE